MGPVRHKMSFAYLAKAAASDGKIKAASFSLNLNLANVGVLNFHWANDAFIRSVVAPVMHYRFGYINHFARSVLSSTKLEPHCRIVLTGGNRRNGSCRRWKREEGGAILMSGR